MSVLRLDRRLLYALATSDRFEAVARRDPRVERLAYRAARRYVAGSGDGDAAGQPAPQPQRRSPG